MNKKQLLLLIIVGAVVGGISYTLSKKEQATWSQSAQRMGEKVVPDFQGKLNQVESVSIKGPTSALTLAKKGEIWGVADRSDYPANFETLHGFLLKVLDLKVGQPVKAGAGQLSRLDLLSPDKGTNGGAGTLVEFKDKSGKTLSSLILGRKVTKDSGAAASPFGGGGPMPVGRYIMADNDAKNIAIVSEAFANIEPKAEEWLDKDFLKVEKIRSISVTTGTATNDWKMSRETESGEWKLADAKPEEKLDTTKVSNFNWMLASASFHDVAKPDAKPEQTGLDKPTVAKLETFENFVYEVKIGKTDPENHYYVQFTTTANLPKERTPGKDEKAEDKDKLDKEFKEKTSKAQDKLKKEQFHDKWVYLVDSYTIESLVKPRREFISDKKDESKAGENRPPNGGADLLPPGFPPK